MKNKYFVAKVLETVKNESYFKISYSKLSKQFYRPENPDMDILYRDIFSKLSCIENSLFGIGSESVPG